MYSVLGTAYAPPAEMNALLRRQYVGLAERSHLRGIPNGDSFSQQLATAWGEINHGHAFREGNTRTQVVLFEQLAEQAGWSLDVSRFAPHHPQSIYRDFVEARFAHQAQRGAEGAGASQAALPLANVLSSVMTPDRSREGSLRRGEPPMVPVRSKDHLDRFPELRDITLEHGVLVGSVGAEPRAGDDQYH